MSRFGEIFYIERAAGDVHTFRWRTVLLLCALCFGGTSCTTCREAVDQDLDPPPDLQFLYRVVHGRIEIRDISPQDALRQLVKTHNEQYPEQPIPSGILALSSAATSPEVRRITYEITDAPVAIHLDAMALILGMHWELSGTRMELQYRRDALSVRRMFVPSDFGERLSLSTSSDRTNLLGWFKKRGISTAPRAVAEWDPDARTVTLVNYPEEAKLMESLMTFAVWGLNVSGIGELEGRKEVGYGWAREFFDILGDDFRALVGRPVLLGDDAKRELEKEFPGPAFRW